MNQNTRQIIALADGERSSVEIAKIVGLTPRYVRKVCQKKGLPLPPRGAQKGRKNHQFVSGRRVDRDGYVTVTAPNDHPNARQRPHRQGKLMFEHRLVMEKKIGRHLTAQEVVDHIDGLTLHNSPDNLRLFASNGEHLAATATGPRRWSPEGRRNIGRRSDLGQEFQRVDTYRQRRECGDVRLRQILLAALKLGIDSPYLLGTHRHLEQKQIDWTSHTNLERELDLLYLRWGWGQTP